MKRARVALFVIVLAPLATVACKKLRGEDPQPPAEPPVVVSSATTPVPPVGFAATPVEAFAEAGLDPAEAGTPYEQARAYEASGQLWLARLVLEKKALSPDGTKEEAELLASICNHQGDEECLLSCSEKLGRKLKLDGGARRVTFDAGEEHQEPDTDLARARNLVLKKQPEAARALLEPRVLDGTASKEEVRLLKTVCKEQGDRMCVALCDAKLK